MILTGLKASSRGFGANHPHCIELLTLLYFKSRLVLVMFTSPFIQEAALVGTARMSGSNVTQLLLANLGA